MQPVTDQAQAIDIDFVKINLAFSKQSTHYDLDDAANPILKGWRKQVYQHMGKFLTPASHILELNSGTGIDAIHFVEEGHRAHCTDVSEGMIRQLEQKKQKLIDPTSLTVQQCSFDALNQVEGKFDYVFSNFGGLNCIHDLSRVTQHLAPLLKPGAFVTWVIMPPVCFWEIRWILQGPSKIAFRRFQKQGTLAHLEGEYFRTYYFSLTQIRKAFGKDFQFIQSEGLGALSPPPSESNFLTRHPRLYRMLIALDNALRNHFPFNRWADHIIVTFKYTGTAL